VIVDTSVNARMQAALEPRIHLSTRVSAALETVSAPDWIGASRTVARAMARSPVDTTVKDLLASSFAALDLLGIGLAVCNLSSQLLVANGTAEQILRTRDGLELDSDQVLCATHECNPSLSQLVQQAARSAVLGKAGDNDAMLAIPRSSDKRALTVLVRAANGASTKETHSEQPAALVLILDSALPAKAAEPELRQLYGLTSTEARLANLLMEGKTLDECGCQLGIRRSTVRMHLRNLFAKTGVRRQGELVSLLLKSIGLGPRKK